MTPVVASLVIVPVAGVAAKVGAPESDGAAVDLPDAVQLIDEGRVHIVVNTPRGRGARADGAYIRRAAGRAGLPLFTNLLALVGVA